VQKAAVKGGKGDLARRLGVESKNCSGAGLNVSAGRFPSAASEHCGRSLQILSIQVEKFLMHDASSLKKNNSTLI
jgi:hypothetical protein